MALSKTYGTLHFNGIRWEMNAVEPHVRIKLKNLFPKIPKHSPPPYFFDNIPDVCADLAWFMARYPMNISHEDMSRLESNRNLFYGLQAEMERILLPDWSSKTVYQKAP